jgi:DNA-binding response OmpR family regulator
MEMETRILIVDDDREFRTLLAGALKKMGDFLVDDAESAEDALQKIEGEAFDVVLVDLNLPKMDGLELITRMVNLRPNIFTILVTGCASIESAVEAMKRGASDYLTKPFELEEILIRIRRVLEESKRFTSIEGQGRECSFSWEKLKEMKENQTEFWAGDGFTRLRLVEVSDRDGMIHMITTEGRLTWPLKFKKLEEVHDRIHRREIGVMAYEIERYIPTWGNYVAGLLRYFGCERV